MKAHNKKKSIVSVSAQAAKPAPVLVDTAIAYNSSGRFKRTEYAAKVSKVIDDERISKSTAHSRFLITSGDKGKLINMVFADHRGAYTRQAGETVVYGHLTSLNELESGIKAELLTPRQLVDRLLTKKKVYRFKHRETGEEVDAILLNPSTDPYFVGVTLDKAGQLRVLNMEPPAKYNKKHVQWVQLKDVTDAKLVTRLANYGSKTLKAA